MRFVLPILALLVFAPPVAAQESAQTPASATVTDAEATPAPAPGPRVIAPRLLDVEPVGPTLDGVATPLVTAPVVTNLDAPANADEAALQQPRNFWWLVGAIVLAGIVLAVVL